MLLNEDFLDNLDDRDIVSDEVEVDTLPQKTAPDDYDLIFQVNCKRDRLIYTDQCLKHLFKTFAPITAYSKFMYVTDPYSHKKETYRIEDALNTSEDYIYIRIGVETNFRTLNQILTFVSIIDDIEIGQTFAGIEFIINTQKYGRRLWITNTQYLRCYRKTGKIDVCLDQRKSAHDELVEHLSQFISLLIPERLQLREFNKLVDFMGLTLQKRIMNQVCDKAFRAPRTYNFTLPKEFKKKIAAETLDLGTLVGNKNIEMIYCQDGQVKDLEQKTSNSEEFRAMAEQLGTVSCKDFQLRGNYWNNDVYLIIWVGTFLYDRKERATSWDFSKMPLSAAIAFKFDGIMKYANYEPFVNCLRNDIGIDITEKEILDILKSNEVEYRDNG